MQTHRDDDAPDSEALKRFREAFGDQPHVHADEPRKLHDVLRDRRLAELRDKAAKMVAAGESQITAGAPGEAEVFCRCIGRVTVRKLPRDPLCTRISVGGMPGDDSTNYLVYRGDGAEVRRLLTEALDSMGDLP